jgi:uncharacterized protein
MHRTCLLCLALLPLFAFYQPPPPMLLISEVDYDPPGRDEVGEWIELVVLGDEPLSLAGYQLGDEEQRGGSEGMFRFPDDAIATPGQVLVIARSGASFRARFGLTPDFEFYDSDPAISDMLPSAGWATGELMLANDGDEVVLIAPDGTLRDAVNWGSNPHFFTPTVPLAHPGQTLARLPAHCDRDTAADWAALDRPTPGMVNLDGDCRSYNSAPASAELTGPIGTIQGSGTTSPYLDQVVAFRGLVTAMQEHRNTRGAIFYTTFVQDEPSEADGDPATSDAVAVFTATARPSFQPGDIVDVRGRVIEFYGLTEIDFRDLNLVALGGEPASLPPPFTLTSFAPDALESLEGMRVTLPAVRVAGATHSGCGFAVAGLETTLPLLLEDPVVLPGPVLPVLHPSNVHCEELPELKHGDLVNGLTGVLTYQFDQYQLIAETVNEIEVSAAPLPEPVPVAAPPPDQIMVVTLNLHDYFTTDPLLAIRQDKIADLLSTYLLCPAIIAVQEVDNTISLRELAIVVGDLCATTYSVAHRDGPDARGLDVGLLVDAQRVQIVGIDSHQACTPLDTGVQDDSISCPAGQSPLHSRPPLQVSAVVDGKSVSFYVNHLKSKREGEVQTAPWRLAQASHLASLVAAELEQAPDTAILVLGDFNDLPLSPPLQTLQTAAPLADPLRDLPAATRYTYVFGGYAELLDNILLSPAALSCMTGAGILHMNADYPYTWATNPATPYRASDHDVPWVTLALQPAAPPTPTPLPAASATPATLGNPAQDPSPSPTATPQPEQPAGSTLSLAPPVATVAVLATVASVALVALVVRRRRH